MPGPTPGKAHDRPTASTHGSSRARGDSVGEVAFQALHRAFRYGEVKCWVHLVTVLRPIMRLRVPTLRYLMTGHASVNKATGKCESAQVMYLSLGVRLP